MTESGYGNRAFPHLELSRNDPFPDGAESKIPGANVGRQREPAVRLLALGFQQTEMVFDLQAAGTTARMVNCLSRLGIEQAGFDDGDLAGNAEFPGALPLTFRKSSQQVRVGPPEDVRLHIIQTKPVVGIVQHLDQC